MPTAFAHALVGAAIASAAAPRARSRGRLVCACALVAAAPDLDVAGFWWGIPYDHALGHRGLSHSLPFAAAAGLGAACWLRLRSNAGPDARARAALAGLVIALACASHGVLDGMTDAGLGIGFWLPFSNERWFLPWRPIMTSSLDPRAAFGVRGLEVLRNEALWIGLPTAAVMLVASFVRRRRSATV